MKSQSEIYLKNNPEITVLTVNSGFTEMSKTFNEALREKLSEKQIKPAELARRAKITKQNIGRIINNTRHPITGALPSTTRETVEKIANALDWDINEALTLAGYAPETNYPPEFARQFNRLNELTKDLPEDEREKAIREFKTLVDFFLHKYKKD
jgi:transcriptional regulator with XRE-family HTH domain